MWPQFMWPQLVFHLCFEKPGVPRVIPSWDPEIPHCPTALPVFHLGTPISSLELVPEKCQLPVATIQVAGLSVVCKFGAE